MKKIKNIFLLLIVGGLFFTSCKKDDYTGDSVLAPSGGVSVAISGPSGTTSLVESETVYTVNVNLSSAQVVDIDVYMSMVEGTATNGVDFKFDTKVTIPAYTTSGSFAVTIFKDDINEATETFKLQVGDERTTNASVSAAYFDFEILNLTGNDLSMDLGWTTNVNDVVGIDDDATDVADMVFSLWAPDNSLVSQSDGGGFEALMMSADSIDGDYTLTASIYGVRDYGDLNDNISISLDLGLFQVGLIDEAHSFANGLVTIDNLCSTYTLGTITKAGSSYSFAAAGQASALADLTGVYDYVTNGMSTDGCCPDPVDVTGVVTLTSTGVGTYGIDDWSGGLYVSWYAVYGILIDHMPGDVKLNSCNEFSLLTASEPFGESLSGSGSLDPDTGVITYHWSNAYGDFGDVVLTPQ